MTVYYIRPRDGWMGCHMDEACYRTQQRPDGGRGLMRFSLAIISRACVKGWVVISQVVHVVIIGTSSGGAYYHVVPLVTSHITVHDPSPLPLNPTLTSPPPTNAQTSSDASSNYRSA